ncbi:hypothetical protein D9M70_541550 [compost metagenome]
MASKETLAFCDAIITSVRSTPFWPTSKAVAMSVETFWVAATLFTACPSMSAKLGISAAGASTGAGLRAMASICMARISNIRRLNSTPWLIIYSFNCRVFLTLRGPIQGYLQQGCQSAAT